ncbi:hypothetical protein HPP92_027833 [Vanilla planifolia]|uniref:RIN4 pathogenic type III effector avirulence factor Avr cleavage site domain-containing protein n=1 Tax=Vanilla planifolia TaxID=51239 RepID=A0A835U4W1_VANPL|nr:hypothetical protein HPP92_027833 [Vanilla planifolia]
MAKNTQGAKGEWMSVPAFGDWDQQKGMPDYSLDFSKIREMRMQNKSDYSHISVGNEEELIPRPGSASAFDASTTSVPPAVHHQESPSGRKKFISYFVCCTRA